MFRSLLALRMRLEATPTHPQLDQGSIVQHCYCQVSSRLWQSIPGGGSHGVLDSGRDYGAERRWHDLRANLIQPNATTMQH